MHIHILGICGTFMGGVAALAREAGHKVTGCDAGVYPPMSDQLRALGIELIEGYGVEQLALQPDMYVVGNVVSRAETPKFSGTPPIKKPGCKPALSKIQASMVLVVVLPCVPATASTWRPCSTCSASHCGPLV